MACRRTTARRPPAPRALTELRELGFYLSAQHCGDRVFLRRQPPAAAHGAAFTRRTATCRAGARSRSGSANDEQEQREMARRELAAARPRPDRLLSRCVNFLQSFCSYGRQLPYAPCDRCDEGVIRERWEINSLAMYANPGRACKSVAPHSGPRERRFQSCLPAARRCVTGCATRHHCGSISTVLPTRAATGGQWRQLIPRKHGGCLGQRWPEPGS